MKWQPIETAPKDETNILLLSFTNNDDYHNDITIGFWGDLNGAWAFESKQFGWCDWSRGLTVDEKWERVIPTHWMPLPPEPTE